MLKAVDDAVAALQQGLLVAVPTDTVYGLAADPFHTGASDRIYAAKRRPRQVDLPVLVADREQALSVVIGLTEAATRLMDRFWPGALTLVLPRRPDVRADLGADEATVGLRCPDHGVPREVCRRAGPLATTSANLHGQAPLTTAAEVALTFGDAVGLVLDAGPCVGTPSTVVDCTGLEPRLLRDGRIPWAEVVAAARG